MFMVGFGMDYRRVVVDSVNGMRHSISGSKLGDALRVQFSKKNTVCYVVVDQSNVGYMYHRLDGPSYIMDNGWVFYSINDRHYELTEEYCRAAGMSDEETLMWVLRFGDKLPTTCEEYYGVGWESIPVDQL